MSPDHRNIHPVVAEVTARIIERSRARAHRLPAAPRRRRRARTRPWPAGLRQPRARLRRLRPGRQDGAARQREAQRRDRLGLQRHALGAPALRVLPGPAQAGGDPVGRHRAVRRRRARDVRRRHPGPRRHGAVAVQPRRDRDVDRDRALARHVRRRADARRLRQDRARPADRRAVLRPPADDLRAGRADDLGPAERREGRDPAAVRRRRDRPRRAARGRVGVVPLGRAPAPSTAPPTPTRC